MRVIEMQQSSYNLFINKILDTIDSWSYVYTPVLQIKQLEDHVLYQY